MQTLILTLHIIVCVVLVILILLQAGKEGMGVIFGGGNTSVFGSSGAGGLSPEAHLDLHGLNAQQAFETLRGFMRGSWYKGLRTILVVPGRGKNSPDGVGVLRGKLQSWLTQDPFRRVVLAFCTAQTHDGGPGSVYVRVRKYKKKGRVSWERMPADADHYE